MRILCLVMVALMLCGLGGCMPRANSGPEQSGDRPAGFLQGIWHGWIAPVSLILQWVTRGEFTIYDSYNNGAWYNTGYYLAIVGGWGALALRRKKSK